MKVSELVTKTELRIVPKGHNLQWIGWSDGYLVVQFFGRKTLYIFGPDIEEHKLEQILKNPFPDALFQKAIKSKYRCHKVAA